MFPACVLCTSCVCVCVCVCVLQCIICHVLFDSTLSSKLGCPSHQVELCDRAYRKKSHVFPRATSAGAHDRDIGNANMVTKIGLAYPTNANSDIVINSYDYVYHRDGRPFTSLYFEISITIKTLKTFGAVQTTCNKSLNYPLCPIVLFTLLASLTTSLTTLSSIYGK